MHSGGLLALAAAVLVLPVGLGIVGYVVATFALMRRHVERRSTRRHLREALREIAWTALTQPLLPLFYVIGRRLAGGHGTPVVVVHGYTQNRVDFLRIARALSREHLGPVYGFNYPWLASIHGNAARLARFVEQVRGETGAAQVDLVAHSLGGLVAMDYLHEAGRDRVRRLVTIASPHAGVQWRGPIVGAFGSQIRQGCAFLVARATRALPAPCLSIYSTHDNIVYPPQTSMLALRGGQDHAVADLGHLSILFDPAVAQAVVAFLGAPGPSSGAALGPESPPGFEPAQELLRA